MKILVTGCSGFIGSHLCEELLKLNNIVFGIDNMNNYYSIEQKQKNLDILNKYVNFYFINEDIINTNQINYIKPDKVVHLAALAGVRLSLEKPKDYFDINVKGFINIIEQCKNLNITLIYASSSSVYGSNKKIPFNENDTINNIESPYACSKKCKENIAQMYSNIYNLQTIGLRFFTVYGPRGRPDMAPYKFIKNILDNKEILKFGDGTSARDYTYISDIISGILSVINKNVFDNKFKIYNLGNNTPIKLNTFIEICEKVTKKKAMIINKEKQKGDVDITYADISLAEKELNYNPKIKLEEGLLNLVEYLK